MRQSAFVLAALAFAATAAQAAELKVGYVDLERAVNETAEGKTEYAKLKTDFDLKQKQLDLTATELKGLQAKYEQQSVVVSNEAKMKNMQELQQKVMEAQQLAAKLQQDLLRKELEVKDRLLGKMLGIIQDIAEGGSFTLVLERKQILYAPRANDLTNEVIRRYDAKYSPKKN